jgi:two-component system KDP operon response regulator KdpE
MTRVLVVDDELPFLRALHLSLSAHRYEVVTAADGAAALDAAVKHPPDIVLLDLGLPDMDGGEVIARLRAWTQVPILVLSGRADAAGKVGALDAGADDYVTKPFSIDELTARIRALLRRAEPDGAADPVVEIGHHLVDLTARTVVRSPDAPTDAAEHIRLTKTEWAVLEILVRNPGRLVSGQQLLKQVWGPAYGSETGYLRFYLAKLRRKLEPEPSRPQQLLTEPGMGYRFQPRSK